jgi:hypothetical protein
MTTPSPKPTHTPGPWRWLPKEGQFIVAANSRIVAEVPCQGCNPSDGPLIAAAPELLEALKAIVNSSDYGSPLEGDDNRPLMRNARAAIAKAEGR